MSTITTWFDTLSTYQLALVCTGFVLILVGLVTSVYCYNERNKTNNGSKYSDILDQLESGKKEKRRKSKGRSNKKNKNKKNKNKKNKKSKSKSSLIKTESPMSRNGEVAGIEANEVLQNFHLALSEGLVIHLVKPSSVKSINVWLEDNKVRYYFVRSLTRKRYSIELNKVIEIYAGKQSDVFQKNKKSDFMLDELCFSLKMDDNTTYDFRANSKIERDAFYQGFCLFAQDLNNIDIQKNPLPHPEQHSRIIIKKKDEEMGEENDGLVDVNL